MRHIFIDANIYLRFYLVDQPLFQRALPALTGIEDRIFITTQIATEVRRNKVQVFLAQTTSFLAQIPKSINLPPIDRSRTSLKAKDWRNKTKALKNEMADCQAQYRARMKAEAKKIAEATDAISVSLEQIFRHELQATPAQINRARQRKELGNPPGKRADPLGDQISWEQFLDQCIKDQPAWIITKDRDFFDVVVDEIRLKPTLETELRRKIGKTASIYVFDDPLAGLESYKAKSGDVVKNLPTEEEIKKIYQQQQDPTIASLPRLPSTFPPTPTSVLGNTPITATSILDHFIYGSLYPTPAATSMADFIVSSSLSNTAPSLTGTTEWTCPSCGNQNSGTGILGGVCGRCHKLRP